MSTVLAALLGLLTELDGLPRLTARFTDPFSVDAGTDQDCLPPRDCGRENSAQVDGETDFEPQDCLPPRDCGKEDPTLALKDLAPLPAPLLRKGPGSEDESLAQEVWLLPPPRIFLPLTMPTERIASTEIHLYPWHGH